MCGRQKDIKNLHNLHIIEMLDKRRSLRQEYLRRNIILDKVLQYICLIVLNLFVAVTAYM